MKKNLKETIIICAFGSCGKTTCVNNCKDNYSLIEFPETIITKDVDPNFAKQIADTIYGAKLSRQYDMIIVNYHYEVLKALFENGLRVTVIVPLNTQECQIEWLARSVKNGHDNPPDSNYRACMDLSKAIEDILCCEMEATGRANKLEIIYSLSQDEYLDKSVLDDIFYVETEFVTD